MIKKVLIGSGVAMVLGTFVFGRDVFSYMRTGASSVRQAVRAEVPVEFEIERAKRAIDEIVPEIENCMHVIAEQQYDLERRQTEIARREADLAGQKGAIMALRADLDSGRDRFVYASRHYTASDVRGDLARRFDRFKLAQDSLGRDKQVVEARRKALAANEQKLDNMLAVKKDLAVQIESLQARLNTVQAAETVSDLRIDDSSLARAKELIRELDKQIGTRETMLNNEARFTGEIPVEAEQETRESDERAENVESEIDAYFGDDAEPAANDVAA